MKKILVFTSTRADFGLLAPMIEKLIQDKTFSTTLFVTGTHLDEKFGSTVVEITNQFPAVTLIKVPFVANSSVAHHQLALMSSSFTEYSKALEKQTFDMAIVLGDRFEAFCFASVCATLRIPLAHIHGGELTYGALDDKYRHAITKLSELHFTSCEDYRQRVIQMGEEPHRVFNVGALGVENALAKKRPDLNHLATELKFNPLLPIVVFTFHPETTSSDFGSGILKKTLAQLKKSMGDPAKPSFQLIITGSNIDHGQDIIRSLISNFVAGCGPAASFYESLGYVRYNAIVSESLAVVGNSSSGVIEAHALGTPALNIGRRQAGRMKNATVIDLETEIAVEKYDFSQLKQLKSKFSALGAFRTDIFGAGQASLGIYQALKSSLNSVDSHSVLHTEKTFFTLNKTIL